MYSGYRAAFYPGGTPGVLTPGGSYGAYLDRSAFYPGGTPGILTPGMDYTNYRASFYPGGTPGTLTPGPSAVASWAMSLFGNNDATPIRTMTPGASGTAGKSMTPLLIAGGAIVLLMMASKKRR